MDHWRLLTHYHYSTIVLVENDESKMDEHTTIVLVENDDYKMDYLNVETHITHYTIVRVKNNEYIIDDSSF